jgi:hypothetical protein
MTFLAEAIETDDSFPIPPKKSPTLFMKFYRWNKQKIQYKMSREMQGRM